MSHSHASYPESGARLRGKIENPCGLRSCRPSLLGDESLETGVAAQRIEHWIEPKQRRGERHAFDNEAGVRYRENRLECLNRAVWFSCLCCHTGKQLELSRPGHRILVERNQRHCAFR